MAVHREGRPGGPAARRSEGAGRVAWDPEGKGERRVAAHSERDGGSFLGAAFWFALLLLLAEAVGGWVSHSLALWSDAGHMLTDLLSLGLAWYAARLARRAPTPRHSYGFHRAGILTALFNAGTLLAISAVITVEAVGRLGHPVAVHPAVMWAVAALGLVGNLFIGLRLGHAGHAHGPLNVRAAWLHVMGDAAASAAVLVAGILVAITGRLWWDPLASLAVALLIAFGAWRLAARTVDVLMEGTPPGIEPQAVAAALEADVAVLSAHHVHIWSLDGRRTSLSGHLVLRDGPLSDTRLVLDRVGRALQTRFGICHATLQLESEASGPCPDGDCGHAASPEPSMPLAHRH